jgi:farnesyl diphosphate synthase
MTLQTAVAIPVAVQTIGIPVLLVSAAAFQIAHRLDDMAAAFFSFSLVEKLSVLTILFSLVFAAVATSHSVSVGGDVFSSSSSSSSMIPYPLDAIQAATTDKDKFLSLYPLIKEQMLTHLSCVDDMPQEATQWCADMMDYNVPGGKLNRGTMVPTVLAAMQQQPLTPLQYARAGVLGWAIEFLQAFFLVADDVMDDSPTRRGQPCWYKLPNVRMIAINDSFLLESFVFAILKLHFGRESYYGDLVALMLDVVQKTEIGQLLDLTSQPMDTTQQPIDLDRFTLQRYRLIVKYKTAFYSFYLPVAMGMILSGIRDKKAYDLANKICMLMGEYFQVQDDFLDCYGDPQVIGKVGTDIQDNKCSWLVVQALKRATPQQKKLLKDNYGKWDDKCVARVKDLYKELQLEKLFRDYEEQSYLEIQRDLEQVTLVPRAVFDLFLQKIYKRSK